MLRRQGKKEPPKAEPKDSISRQEAVIWLGRAMSTNEITLRVMLELLDVVAFQQAQLKNLTEHDTAGSENGAEPSLTIEPGGTTRAAGESAGARHPQVVLPEGAAEKILEKLTQLREQVTPTLKIVEDACRQFEEML